MNRGYIKLWRKIEDSGLLGNAELCQLFMFLMVKVTHKPRKIIVGPQAIALKPGQYFAGRKQLACELNSTEQKIRTALSTLQKLEIINQQPTSKGTVISLVNWGKYQDEQPALDQHFNQQLTSSQPAPNQHLTTKQTHNTENKKDSYESSSTAEADDSQAEVKSSGFSQCPHQEIIAAYHEVLPELPKVRGWNDSRAKQLNARWRESLQRLRKVNAPYTKEAGIDWWRQFFHSIRAAPHYLHGFQRKDGTYWRPPGLVWFLSPDKFLKIIENGHLSPQRPA